MPTVVRSPVRVPAAGTAPKSIDEHVGRVSTGSDDVSIAQMRSPEGWVEPGQCPEFRECTLVLAGTLRVEHESGSVDVAAGQTVIVEAGEWVRYSTPLPGGAHYVAVCLPAFTLERARRDP